MTGFSFKKQNQVDPATNLTDAKVIIHDDGSGNKYTFGLDVSNVFNTFKYESGGSTVDYSALATQFMTGGIAGTLLGKLTTIDTNVGTINSNVGTVKNDVDAIKAKTEKLDLKVATGTLGEALDKLAKTTDLTPLAKADQLPANLTTRLEALNLADTTKGLGEALGKLAKTTDLTPLAKTTELDPLATAASIIALGTKVAGIESKTNPIPANLTTRLDALNPDASSNSLLGATLKGIKDKTDLLDLSDTNTPGRLGKVLKGIQDKTDKLDLENTAANSGTLGEALSELAKANQLPADLTERLNALKPDITGTPAANSLGATLKGIKDKTDLLDLSDTNTPGRLGKVLKGIQDKTDKLDLENTAANSGTLGEALSELAKANQLPADLTERLNALKPDATGTLGATLKEIKDKTDKLDLADTEGTLGEALGKLAKAQKLLDRNIIADAEADLDSSERLFSSESPSNSGYTSDENMLGKYSPDQFLG